MSDTENTGDKTIDGPKPRKTLSLKRTVESGTVRQNFSHGRSKAVVVEKKRRRPVAPAEAVEVAPKPAPEPEAPKPEPKPKAEPAKADKGMVLRTLTDDEKDARAQALVEAREREKVERAQA
ncbi:MAG: translation initiation factor IF-2 associated domain-containing protein, partial [Pseudomonadota bacterium]